jgi:hypothetical protein
MLMKASAKNKGGFMETTFNFVVVSVEITVVVDGGGRRWRWRL